MSDERFDKIEIKIDKLDERLDKIDVTLAAQHESLKSHMKRTELLEAQVKPLNIFMDRIKFTGVILGILGGTIVGLGEAGILKAILEYFAKH